MGNQHLHPRTVDTLQSAEKIFIKGNGSLKYKNLRDYDKYFGSKLKSLIKADERFADSEIISVVKTQTQTRVVKVNVSYNKQICLKLIKNILKLNEGYKPEYIKSQSWFKIYYALLNVPTLKLKALANRIKIRYETCFDSGNSVINIPKERRLYRLENIVMNILRMRPVVKNKNKNIVTRYI